MYNSLGTNLKKYRLLNNMSLKKVGELLNISATAVKKYEDNLIVPDSTRLIEFAKIYKANISDLLKIYKEPIIEFDSYRKKNNLTGKELDLLKQIIQNEISKYLEVLELSNQKYNYVNTLPKYKCQSYEEVPLIAKKFRENKKINNLLPISDLTNILENLGICIIYLKNLDNRFNNFDGFSAFVDNIPVIVILEEEKDGGRQRFTLAHELGHLILDVNNKNLNIEKLCNQFASNLLMPKEAFVKEFGLKRTRISCRELEIIKQEYKVDYKAIIYRLKELNIISEYYCTNLCILLNKNNKEIPLNLIKPEKTNHFEKMVYQLETMNIIGIRKACELLGVNHDEYRRQYNYN